MPTSHAPESSFHISGSSGVPAGTSDHRRPERGIFPGAFPKTNSRNEGFMASDKLKDVSKTVKFDEAIHSQIMACLKDRRVCFSDFIRAAIAWSAEEFEGPKTAWKWGFVWERWITKHGLSGDLVIKPFRLSEPFDRWARQLASDLDTDFSSLTIRSALLYLPYFEGDPESVAPIYQRWLELQSNRCITKPIQLEMKAARS
jgi:hypothetical protein